MLCYLDRAFCSSSDEALGGERCTNETCSRCLLPREAEKARERDLSVAWMPFRSPTCGFRSSKQDSGTGAK